jgi:hypothetical protein
MLHIITHNTSFQEIYLPNTLCNGACYHACILYPYHVYRGWEAFFHEVKHHLPKQFRARVPDSCWGYQQKGFRLFWLTDTGCQQLQHFTFRQFFSRSKTSSAKTVHKMLHINVKMLHIDVKLLHILLKNIPCKGISLAYRLVQPCVISHTRYLHVSHAW